MRRQIEAVPILALSPETGMLFRTGEPLCLHHWQHASLLLFILTVLECVPQSQAIHHMKRHIAPRQNSGGDGVPLTITNWCGETIYPGINTQGGTSGPSQTGFELQPGNTQNFTVSADWQGRVWGRTNCSFNSQGNGPANGGNGGWSACQTGDCNAQVSCSGTVC